MLDVGTFLMRWLFLSNLLRDVAEIQTLPQEQIGPPPPTIDLSKIPRHYWESHWRDLCLRGILSCPPGHQRLLTIDAFRVELVQQLVQTIRDDTDVLKTSQRHRWRQRHQDHNTNKENEPNLSVSNAEEGDPYRDADLEIIKAMESMETESDDNDKELAKAVTWLKSRQNDAFLSISEQGNVNASTEENDESPPLEPIIPADSVSRAIQSAQQTREYLPQLVAAVLKSPPASNPSLANPVQRLRHVLLDRCLQDPSWGIEMCWLLEAEVGRAWKTLFEHRQQTGRRLIVVLPAEKAAVLAKIGSEKHEAFDLLQDAEQATAYGYRTDKPFADAYPAIPTEEKRLPSSLSLRRCSHFGDTMHFIDRLTKVSLDLRNVPIVNRQEYLQQQLAEMNRRIRRRMVTRGEISLDVDDHRGPYEWPSIGDLRTDLLKYSVHFPLVPQIGMWPTGSISKEESAPTERHTVARVLNIVTSESRLLSSRERCPFLVHLEVADTGMDGSDTRLYASGVPDLYSTVEEALSLFSDNSDFPRGYKIPKELLRSSSHSSDQRGSGVSSKIIRGGWQSADQTYYQEDGSLFGYNPPQTPYDIVREQELESLHQQLSHQQQIRQFVPDPLYSHLSVGDELLENVFGKPWAESCREIREQSPFGRVEGWKLASFIIKAGEDIRREALVMQIISKFRKWFEEDISEEHRPYMRPYTIMCVGGDAGLVECLSDAKSVDEVKKRTDHFASLREYFERAYGPPLTGRGNLPPPPPGTITFEAAQDNFLRSLVGYSLVCFVLQIKDRHNANILMDREGHIMHIDFGFVLGDTPKMAKVPIFSERAPFKLSQEFWAVLGGWNINNGGLGVKFCKMFELAFACASAHVDEIACLVEATMLALHHNPRTARLMASGVRSRLRMRGPPGSTQQKMFIMDLVNAALTSWGTTTYDWLQKNMNGYQ